MDSQCPICKSPANEHPKGGGSLYVECIRCGDFSLTGTAVSIWGNHAKRAEAQAAVSHYIRRLQTGDKAPTLNSEELERAAKEQYLPTAREQADNLIRYLGDKTLPGNSVQIDNEHFGGIAGAVNAKGLMFVLKGLMREGLVEERNIAAERIGLAELTFDGWSYCEDLRKGEVASAVAFMAMPFDEPLVEDALENCFRCAVEETGYRLEKLDDQPRAGLIDDHLRVAIQSCRFLIADLTGNNNGSYWEAGYAEGLGKDVIYTCERSHFDKNEKGVHFDTNHHLHVLWEVSDYAAAAKKLKDTIRATIPEAKREDVPVR